MLFMTAPTEFEFLQDLAIAVHITGFEPGQRAGTIKTIRRQVNFCQVERMIALPFLKRVF